MIVRLRAWWRDLMAAWDARRALDLHEACPHVEVGSCARCESDWVAEGGM